MAGYVPRSLRPQSRVLFPGQDTPAMVLVMLTAPSLAAHPALAPIDWVEEVSLLQRLCQES